jgi:hypothetical protein
MMAMSNFEMRIYTAFNGVEATITLANEDEYRAGKKFLEDAGAEVMDIASSNRPTESKFAYVEKKEQVQGLGEFVKSLRQRGNSN